MLWYDSILKKFQWIHGSILLLNCRYIVSQYNISEEKKCTLKKSNPLKYVKIHFFSIWVKCFSNAQKNSCYLIFVQNGGLCIHCLPWPWFIETQVSAFREGLSLEHTPLCLCHGRVNDKNSLGGGVCFQVCAIHDMKNDFHTRRTI
jgi:hypothetical protein